MIRCLSGFALLCLVASPLAAAGLHLNVRNVSIEPGVGQPVVEIVFVGEPLLADLHVSFTKADVEKQPALSGDDWWKQLTWTVRHAGDGSVAGPLTVTHAPAAPPGTGGIIGGKPRDPDEVWRATTVDLGQLPPGRYVIEAALGSLLDKQTILVSASDATPEIGWIYLRGKAQAATSWEEYQRIQLARVQLIPDRPWPFHELGHRATRDGTLAQATDYFERAVAVHEANLRALAAAGKSDLRSRSDKSLHETALVNLWAIRSLLPELFARRGELELVEYLDDSFRNRWGLKDVRTGRIVRVGGSDVGLSRDR